MYFSEFHKNIFHLIEEKKTFDLKMYLDLIRIDFPECELHTGRSIGRNLEVYTFNELEVSEDDDKYVITTKTCEESIFIRFQELIMILDFLESNNLITCIDIPGNKCLAIYRIKDDICESFDDILTLIRKYLNKKIIIREGYSKFKEDDYKTPEEKDKVFTSKRLPIILLMISIILSPIITLFIQRYLFPSHENILPVVIKSYQSGQFTKADSTNFQKIDSIKIYPTNSK